MAGLINFILLNPLILTVIKIKSNIYIPLYLTLNKNTKLKISLHTPVTF